MKAIYQKGKEYVLVASAQECEKAIEAGITIEGAGKYGSKAIKGKPNRTKQDNLRKLKKLKG